MKNVLMKLYREHEEALVKTLEARIRRAGERFESRLREQEDLLASLIVGDVGMLHAPKSVDAPDPVT